MRVVVDTNVIVSGLLTPYRASSEIVLMIVGPTNFLTKFYPKKS